MLTKFKNSINCVHVSEKSFRNQKGDIIPFYRVILIDENGSLFSCTCDRKSFDLISSSMKNGFCPIDVSRIGIDIRSNNNEIKIKLIFIG